MCVCVTQEEEGGNGYSPPATIPAPLISPEKATWNCTAKYPPDDRPDTDMVLASTRYVSAT